MNLCNYPSFISVLFLFCINNSTIYSQGRIQEKKADLNYILQSDTSSQNHLFTFHLQYQYSFGKGMAATGITPNIGFNLARFFSRKFYLGINADFKIIPGASSIGPNSKFQENYNSNLIPEFSSELDSANSAIVTHAINNNQIFGSNYLNLGIGFSPFPQKNGGFFIQVKRGWSSVYLHNVFGNSFVGGGGGDKEPLNFRNNVIVEISFKPAAFSRNTYIDFENKEYNFLNSLMISFYYENIQFSKAEFNGTTIDKIVSEEFLKQYGTDHRFGIKLGVGIY